MPEMPITIPAHAYGGANGTITRIVLHDEEFPVSDTSAHAIAEFFAADSTGTSAHYVVDADGVEHCVAESVTAYHAPPNHGSIGIEHDGYAHFSAEDWAMNGSVATLHRSAVLVADICTRHQLPVQFLSVQDLLDGKSGITTHVNVTNAFHESTHVDPGDSFPIEQFLGWVQEALAADAVSPLLGPGDTGPKVVDIQHALNACGNHLGEDGNFGATTQAVLEVFQRHRHLPVTGTTTEATWAALRHAVHGAPVM